jgi:hypothetical protein
LHRVDSLVIAIPRYRMLCPCFRVFPLAIRKTAHLHLVTTGRFELYCDNGLSEPFHFPSFSLFSGHNILAFIASSIPVLLCLPCSFYSLGHSVIRSLSHQSFSHSVIQSLSHLSFVYSVTQSALIQSSVFCSQPSVTRPKHVHF